MHLSSPYRARFLAALLFAVACADGERARAPDLAAAGSSGSAATGGGNSAERGGAGAAGVGSRAGAGAGAGGGRGSVDGGSARGGSSAADASAADAGPRDSGEPGSESDSGTPARDAGSAVAPGWPDATNTGIPASACSSGLARATEAEITPRSNTTIECVRFVDDVPYLRQDVSNVTYRFCRFETSSDVFLNLQGGPVTIEDSEFSGPAGTWIRAVYEAHGLAVRRCDFSGMANAIEFSTTDVVLEDNYVHDFGNVEEDQHADGFQTEGARGFSIVHNTILFNEVWGSTSALLVSGSSAIVRDNLVAGGGYTIHVAGDLEVTGNRVSTMFHPKSGVWGAVYPESLAASGQWRDNLWHDGPNAGRAIDAP